MEKKINRYRVGELPLLEAIVEKLNLRAILNEFFPQCNNEEMIPSDALILLIYNLAIGKSPLYELDEWVNSLELRSLGYEKYRKIKFTDDRFGKYLDRLYDADRASLLTQIVVNAVQAFNIDLTQIHNDSTSVKAFGKYPGKASTGFELKFGKSKDHRPDLKQLIFSLSISADGAVPIHCRAYPGNRNDDTTHIETWNVLREINKGANFLYVADCKLCTDKQLDYIEQNGGKALTTIPNQWNEVVSFKDKLKTEPITKKEIWRRTLQDGVTDYFSVYEGNYVTTKRGYRIHWIHSSEKKKGDRAFREEQLKKAEKKLLELPPKLNKRTLKTRKAIEDACNKILKQYNVEKFITIIIDETTEERIIKKSRGRPSNSKKLTYDKEIKRTFTLTWNRDKASLKQEEKIDGVYPLLSTDLKLSAKDAIIAFKYQPRLEKRFTQLKSIHNIAPLLFKKIERIEANLLLFFIALMIQALIERQIRAGMKDKEIPSLEVYPENRNASHPTTSKVFDIFSDISTYALTENSHVIERYTDELKPIHNSILQLLSIDEAAYWQRIKESH
jgi:transposase